MNVKLFCERAGKGCDLGDVLEYYERGDYTYAKVRTTDIDTLRILSEKGNLGDKNPLDYYSAGGIVFSLLCLRRRGSFTTVISERPKLR